MDGNGRWAQERGLPRSAGHQAGMQKVRQVIEDCANMGIQILTLYTFSTENWNRPEKEVSYLMFLAENYATRELQELQRNGIRLQLMGKREGLPSSVLDALDNTVKQTRQNSRMILNLALNYGGRAEIIDATKAILSDYQKGQLKETGIDETTITNYLYCSKCPDVDLIIRTGGEWRLSNFMLWRAYEAVFVGLPVLWPDFQVKDLRAAIEIYQRQIQKRNEDA